jgi:leader peptidase (prepilin peptidase)/N-methyltransferase
MLPDPGGDLVTTLIPEAWFLTTLAVLGLVVGSFLNVVIHRVPAGLSVWHPGSSCPRCGHAVRARDNVPVLSWVLLRGRCRDCRSPVSPRYPLVEAATALLFVGVGWRIGASLYLAAALVVVAAGVALVVIDLETQRLPFLITGTTAGGVIAVLAADVARGSTGPVLPALLSMLSWLAVYGGVWLVTGGRGMGLGDVALAPVLGLTLGWLGWGASLVGLSSGFVLGAGVGLVLISRGRAGRRTRVPHGPFLLAGAGVGMLVGQELWTGYLTVSGLG